MQQRRVPRPSVLDGNPSRIASHCTRIVARLSEVSTVVDACYVRYGLDRMWLDCSVLAQCPDSICSIYWQMYTLMASLLATSTYTPIAGKPEEYLDNYYSLELTYTQAHIHETKYSPNNITIHVQEVRNGERDRGALKFFCDLLPKVRELYIRDNTFQWWLATKIAVKRAREISNDPSCLKYCFRGIALLENR